MECQYFGICGSCRLYEEGYQGQLTTKTETIKEQFSPYFDGQIAVYESKEDHYRSRAEFKIYHDDEGSFYAMNRLDKQGVVKIENCSIVHESIAKVMQPLLSEIKEREMGHKLFGIDFLTSSRGEVLASLIYHKALDEQWSIKAKEIEAKLGIYLIGRSRKQKIVLSQDYVTETLRIGERKYHYVHIENSFTQPNAPVNEKMVSWSLEQVESVGGDLLELYCGAGNFTIPFASKFDRVLATEISKASIIAAKRNMELNEVTNIDFVRLSAEEFTQALDGVREFRRLEGLNVGDYHLKTLFVDPPRAGLGEEPCAFAARFDHLLYISCNPETLQRDLDMLTKTHEVQAMAVFDQFPYTHHLEMGVKLIRKGLV
ncbi:MAG TPA: tRNA (uridine(54)-C5)-methyltransferase TrmA [Sulfuricurvum sp.]|nr:tRNA (uridine(54)-C5)-methyltransferase TrmA [Sulfuricurvum sp.]